MIDIDLCYVGMCIEYDIQRLKRFDQLAKNLSFSRRHRKNDLLRLLLGNNLLELPAISQNRNSMYALADFIWIIVYETNGGILVKSVITFHVSDDHFTGISRAVDQNARPRL